MKGWKTWVAAGLAAVVAFIQAIEAAGVIPAGIADTVSIIVGAIAGAFGIVGIGHKVEKLKN